MKLKAPFRENMFLNPRLMHKMWVKYFDGIDTVSETVVNIETTTLSADAPVPTMDTTKGEVDSGSTVFSPNEVSMPESFLDAYQQAVNQEIVQRLDSLELGQFTNVLVQTEVKEESKAKQYFFAGF
jgi:hypothetical protein